LKNNALFSRVFTTFEQFQNCDDFWEVFGSFWEAFEFWGVLEIGILSFREFFGIYEILGKL
jgi:hypothetical protein